MTGYNLPPGCSDSDIHGNRPFDVFYDNWFEDGGWESVCESCDECEINAQSEEDIWDCPRVQREADSEYWGM